MSCVETAAEWISMHRSSIFAFTPKLFHWHSCSWWYTHDIRRSVFAFSTCQRLVRWIFGSSTVFTWNRNYKIIWIPTLKTKRHKIDSRHESNWIDSLDSTQDNTCIRGNNPGMIDVMIASKKTCRSYFSIEIVWNPLLKIMHDRRHTIAVRLPIT